MVRPARWSSGSTRRSLLPTRATLEGAALRAKNCGRGTTVAGPKSERVCSASPDETDLYHKYEPWWSRAEGRATSSHTPVSCT